MLSTWRAWHRVFFYATLILQLLSVGALHEDDVGVIDWHKSLVGLANPKLPGTLPSFHRVKLQSGKTESVVLLGGRARSMDGLSNGGGILAGVDPVDGSLRWRHAFRSNDQLLTYRARPSKDLVATLSGPGGAHLRVFNALQGGLRCEVRLHNPMEGRLQESPHLVTGISFIANDQENSDGVFYTLTNGNTVKKVNERCEVLWTWTSPDESSSVLFTQLLATKDAIYVSGIASPNTLHKLHLVSLSRTDGTLLKNVQLSHKIDTPSSFSLLTFTSSSSPSTQSLVFLEDSRIKHIILTTDLAQSKSAKVLPEKYSNLVFLGEQFNGHMVATYDKTGTSHIFRLRADGSLTEAWTFSGATRDSYTGSPPLFSAGLDKEGRVYISRTIWSWTLNMGSMVVYSEGVDGRGLEHGISFPFNRADQGDMLHIALDASSPRPMVVSPRYVISTSIGGYQLFDREYLRWTREEGLSEITESGVQFVDLPPPKVKEDLPSAGGFVDRLRKQVFEIQKLPIYALQEVQKLVIGQLGNTSNLALRNETTGLYKDPHGFHKIILAASSSGKVYAIDSLSGEVIYSRSLSLGGMPGATFKIVKLLMVRTVADSVDLPPEAALVVIRTSQLGTSTLLYTFEALTGTPTRGADIEGTLEGTVMFDGIARDAHLMQLEYGKLLVVVDEDSKVHPHPENELTQAALADMHNKVHAPYLDLTHAIHRMTGHRLFYSNETQSFQFHPTWALGLPSSHRIQSIFKPPIHQPMASFGKTLANRTTLYKYLNPHLIGVISAAPASLDIKSRCLLHVVDGVTGTVIYQVDVPVALGMECRVKAAIVENWLVYHYWDPKSDRSGGAAGWRIASVEFYEGNGPDESHKSPELSSYARDTIPITIFERAFVFPKDVDTITFTSTANGITVKDLLVSTPIGQIQAFPRRLLDPRRPSSKPSAKEAEEEWLIQYDPMIPDDPRRVISHRYRLASIAHIHTSPATLESTSLVFAHGTDLFFTRVNPSGRFDVLSEGFNKLQLVLTCLALGGAIMITGPMVKRKRLREKWYY